MGGIIRRIVRLKKMDRWDILFYITLIVMFAWFLLKAFGVMNTPNAIEYFPVLGAVFGMGVFYKKVDVMAESINEMKVKIEKVCDEVAGIDKRVSRVESRMKK